MKAFRKLLRANLISFSRERATVFWTFAFPLVFIIIFGGIFGGDSTPTFSVGLVNEAQGQNAETVVQALQSQKALELHAGSRDAELKKLRDGDRKAVVVIAAPPAGGALAVQIYADPAQTATQQVLLPFLEQAIGRASDQISNVRPAIDVQVQSIGSKNLRGIDFLLPGILAMAIMQLGLFSAIPLVTQRETKVLRRLGATPLKRRTMIAAQVTQRLIVAVIQTVVLLEAGQLLFHVKIVGSIPALLFFVVLGALAFVAMGYVVASQAKTAESAQPLVSVIQFPMLFLSGVFFPIELAPKVIQPVVRALPLTYLADAVRQVSVQATPLNPLWVDTVVLMGWLAVCLALSVRLFRWE
ncbi:MAG TPA: ABC transporter permease [Dehalococcoidia bacterium]|nr:ABC transporter permease [Dehalococcoidia bacterium]